MRRLIPLLLACLMIFSSCDTASPEESGVISASVTEYREPETTPQEPETTSAPETTVSETEEETLPETDAETEPEPEETTFSELLTQLPAKLIVEISERLAEVSKSYTRVTETSTEIFQDGNTTRRDITSELLINDGNASFRRTSEDGDEEYFLIDGFLCYGGKYGGYRFGGYDISSFSELAGNYFSLSAFEDGTVAPDGETITLKFDKLTPSGIAEITEMLGLSAGYEISVEKAEFLFVTDSAANMQEKVLTLEATVIFDGEDVLSFKLTSRTEQTGINEGNDIELPAMTSYVLIPDIAALDLYESALADIDSFLGIHQAFEMVENDKITIGGAIKVDVSEKVDYAYAKKIGATFERIIDTGTSQTRVLTHFNRRRAFSQIDSGSIFVDTTFNAKNLESTLTAPFARSLLSFSSFGRIEEYSGGRLVFSLNTEGKIALIRESLLNVGVYAKSISITSSDEARAYITFDSSGKVASIGFSISAHVTADGKTYTVSRTHSLEITKRGSAQVKVIYIDVDEEEEEEKEE